MILINSIIPEYKQKQVSSPLPSRPLYRSKADAFELRSKNISFGNRKIKSHFPIEDVKALLANTLKEIMEAETIEQKINLTEILGEQFLELNSNFFASCGKLDENMGLFCESRGHEASKLIQKLYKFNAKIERNLIICSNIEYDNFCKNTFNDITESIERYELFIEKGLEKNTMKPKDVFNIALDSTKEEAKNKKIEIKITGANLLNNYIKGVYLLKKIRQADYKLYTVFSELIRNALKYSPEGSEIEIKFAIDNESHLIFSVLDNGMGIPVKEQEKVLMEDYRASNVIESGIEGTGKGLSMIEKMVSGLTIKSPVTDNKEFPGTEIIVLLN